jgi:integrase
VGHLHENPTRGVDLTALPTVRPKWVLTIQQAAKRLKALPHPGRTMAGLAMLSTYSSWAHEQGVPGKVVAQLMGHVKVDTTLNVYTQVVDGALRTAVDKIGSGLFTIRKGRRS